MNLFRRKKKITVQPPPSAREPKRVPGVTAKGIPGGQVVCVLHDPAGSCEPHRYEARFDSKLCNVSTECENPYVSRMASFALASGRDARLLAEFFSKVAAIFDQREVAS